MSWYCECACSQRRMRVSDTFLDGMSQRFMCLGYYYSSESGIGSFRATRDELRTVSQYKIEADTVLEKDFLGYWCTWPVDSSLTLGMAAAFPARRSAVSVPEAAWLFGTVTERLAIRADRRLSTPFEQGESGAKRPDLNPGASFEPKCSDRLRCEHAHPSLPPVYFAQCPVRALHMHCVTMN